VEYPAAMLLALRNPIKAKKLPAIDRLALIRDAFALAEAGELPTVRALELVEAYENETDYTVWIELLSGLSSLRNLLYGQSYFASFEKYCLKILNKIGKEVGWQAKKGEGHTAGLLRSLILQQLVSFNQDQALQKGRQLYRTAKNVPADIRSVVYQAVAQTDSKKDYDKFISKYKTEQLSEEKNRIGRALGQFTDSALLKKTLEFAMSANVRIQDTAFIFMSVWGNPKGKKIAWEFTKKNWQSLLKKFPASGHMLNRFIKPASSFISSKDAKDVAAFFKKHSAAGAERAVQQVLEKIYSNDAWFKRDSTQIEKWLSENV
jgi:hypothetical protein